MRPRRLAHAPHRSKKPSVRTRSSSVNRRNRPHRTSSGRPPQYPIPYATSAPTSDPRVANTTRIGTFHGEPVRGSSDAVSAARNPAKGRMISDGIGMMTLSMATHRATPK